MMKILVVDDEPDVEPLLLQGLRRRIRSGDLVLAFAGDGEAALERLAQESGFDIVLTDINMPRMDGLSLLGRLQGRFDLRTVIISAYGDMNNIRNAMNRGAFDFITKPINLVDLEATLDKTARDLEAMRDMRRQRDAAVRARSNLSRYFSPNIVELLSARDKPLAPMRQEVVALFADLVGFTSYAENLEPEVVMDLLREFHSRMSEQVFAFDGTLEKFIGDAMLAVFGVPEATRSDAARALLCAHSMSAALDRWNEERKGAGLTPLAMGIGLHCGPAVMGDIGTERAVAFTVIGDTINCASRLQNLTRDFDCSLVVSQQIIDSVQASGDQSALILTQGLVDHGQITLKGRGRPLPVFSDAGRK